MPKWLHIWLPLLAAYGSLSAAQLTLPALTAAPGSSVLLPIAFAAQSSSVAALQFDLQFDSASLSLTATVGDSARAAGKSLYLWQVYPGLWRFLLFGMNRTAFADGSLVNLFVTVNPAAFPDTYPVQLLNFLASDPSAQSVKLAETDGAITVAGDPANAVLLQPGGVLNGASLLGGAVSPGEIVTLLGSTPAGSTVLFDGAAAPIVYSGPGQINLIVPYGIQKPSTQLQIVHGSQTLTQLSIPVVDATPAIFALDASGTGPGTILNQDYSLNSAAAPAAKGSAIMIYATGAGQTDPPGVDGLIAGATLPHPLLPVTVTIGGLPASVFYAGAAPELIAGMLQVNCFIPAGAPSGWAVPIVIKVGTFTSQPGITMAIQ